MKKMMVLIMAVLLGISLAWGYTQHFGIGEIFIGGSCGYLWFGRVPLYLEQLQLKHLRNINRKGNKR